jgi:hypothetical protein
MLNAIRYTQELEKAGFSRDQAEASVKPLIDVMDENLATKADLKELEFRFGSKFQELEYKLITRLGSLMTVLIGIAVALIKMH